MSGRTRPQPPLMLGADACDEIERHTAHPADYVGHHLWAERMLKAHEQQQCPSCNYWAVWVPKEQA